MKKNYAVIHVDIQNDFVTGVLGFDAARAIIPPLVRLNQAARDAQIPIIYTFDSHLPGIDRELRLWGDHAIRGTKGAEIVPECTPQSNDYLVPKRRYSGFFQTDLHLLLSELGVDTVIITGLHTDMCCRHTAADAFMYGYDVIVPRETTAAFTPQNHADGLAYLQKLYGADICNLDELIARLSEQA